MLVAAFAAAAGPLPAPQFRAIRYDFNVEGASDNDGRPTRGTVIVAGDLSRIDIHDENGGDDDQDFMLLRDGWVYTGHPDRREFSRARAAEFAGVVVG